MQKVCLFVSRVGSLLCLTNRIRICRNPRLIMRHEAIEMGCAHVGQVQEPPPHCRGVLEASAPALLVRHDY